MATSQDDDPIIDPETGPVNGEEAKASKKKLFGNDWAKVIRFYPDTEREYHYNITEDELMTEVKKLVGDDEKIKHVWDYKVVLDTIQPTYKYLYHEFLVFETNGWWWSIEKHPDAITIQRSRKPSCVKDYFRHKPRKKGRARLRKGTGSLSIYELLNWIKSNGELRKEYNLVTSNCQHFAGAVLDQVAEINEAKSNPLFVKSKPRSLRYTGSFTSKSGNDNPSGNDNETNDDVQSVPARDRVDEFIKKVHTTALCCFKATKEFQEIVPPVERRRSQSFHGTATPSLKPTSDPKLCLDEDDLPSKSGLNEEAEKAGPQSRHGSFECLTWQQIMDMRHNDLEQPQPKYEKMKSRGLTVKSSRNPAGTARLPRPQRNRT